MMQSNDFIKFILRSPLHGLLSGGMLLITVTGRKTGRITTLPVQYLRQGNELWITSTRERVWWRNLRGGAEVTLYLRGQEVKGQGEVIEEEPAVANGFRQYFQKAPRSARFFSVKLDPQGNPGTEDIARLSHERVMVRVVLLK
jgi:deazaflavin-dependent oxidoreductase (nitroreductase family)